MLLPEEIALTITAAAISISKQLSPEDSALVGAAFTQLGDTMATIAAARARIDTAKGDPPDEQAEQNKNNTGSKSSAPADAN